MNRVFKSPDFDKNAEKLFSKKDFESLNSFIASLKENSSIGKPLSFNFFREKKISGKRIYFLIYEELELILLVGVSNKKTQQDTIDNIKSYLKEYKEYALLLHNKINKNDD